MVDASKKKKRGAPVKAKKLTENITLRVSKELKDWLIAEGEAMGGLDPSTFARTVLVKEMRRAKSRKKDSGEEA